jgi:hypothetical protein
LVVSSSSCTNVSRLRQSSLLSAELIRLGFRADSSSSSRLSTTYATPAGATRLILSSSVFCSWYVRSLRFISALADSLSTLPSHRSSASLSTAPTPLARPSLSTLPKLAHRVLSTSSPRSSFERCQSDGSQRRRGRSHLPSGRRYRGYERYR